MKKRYFDTLFKFNSRKNQIPEELSPESNDPKGNGSSKDLLADKSKKSKKSNFDNFKSAKNSILSLREMKKQIEQKIEDFENEEQVDAETKFSIMMCREIFMK